MAEVILILGAGAYLASGLFKGTLSNLDEPTQDEPHHLLEPLREMLLHEGRENGIVAPVYQNNAARLPWSMTQPPAYVWASDSAGPTDLALENSYNLFANRLMHNTLDVQEQIRRGRNYTLSKRCMPVYTGFTQEMSLTDTDGERRYTNIGAYQWLPPTPTDRDYTNAAALAKVLPPDPLLFTPDSNYMTAPGLPWRYGGTGN